MCKNAEYTYHNLNYATHCQKMRTRFSTVGKAYYVWLGVDGCEAIWADEDHVDVVIFMNRERALKWEKFLSIKDDIGVLS